MDPAQHDHVGIAFALEPQDCSDVVGENSPFELRDVPLYPPVEFGHRQRGGGGLGCGLEHRHLLVILNMSITRVWKSRVKFARLLVYARYENKRRKPAVKIMSHDAPRAAAAPGRDARARPRAESARAAPGGRRSPR